MAQKSNLIERLQLLNERPDVIKPLDSIEMQDLMFMFLTHITKLQGELDKGNLKGDKGDSPVAGVDFSSKEDTEQMIRELFDSARADMAKTKSELSKAVQDKIDSLVDGKDAKIEDTMIEEMVGRVTEAIVLPDFENLITQEPEAIRDSLELLQGDERLESSAIKGLDERLDEFHRKQMLVPVGSSSSGGASSWLGLTDTPSSFASQALKVVQVNATEDALEFVTLAGGGDALTANPLSQFSATTKAQLNGVISDGTPMYVGDAPTAHTHTASEVTDFDTEVGNNTDVAANTAKRHDAVTVTDSAEIDLTLTGQDIKADIKTGSVDVLKLDAGIQASLGKADTSEQVANKDSANGYAGLDASSKINPTQLPALAISETFVVASEVAQLALTVQEGDIAVRSDENKSYIALNSTNATMSDWQELLTPTDAVQSVFGRSGTVTAQNGDYTADQITETATNKILTSTERTNITANTAKVSATTENVRTAGAVMDDEITNLADVKAFDTTDYATAAQGANADAALPATSYDDATASETNTGTSTAKYVSPDALAGSNFGIRYVQIRVFEAATDTATGDGKATFKVPAGMDGMNLVSVDAEVDTAGTTGTTDIQIHNVDNVLDMLSTKLTIDSAETGSDTAATAAVINTSNDHVNTSDIIRIDVDAVSTTAAQGLLITMGFQLP